MDSTTLGLALGAGMVAALNPCGFAMLPAYLSLLVVPEASGSEGGPGRAIARALLLTGGLTLGFVAVFATFGLVIAPVASSAQRFLPWVTIVVGLVIIGLGGWLLAGRELPTIGRRPQGRLLTRRLSSMFLFGVSYALASLTCTIAPFLAIVVASFRADDWTSGTLLFLAYALGMGAVVGVASVAVALANTGLVTALRRTGRWVPRAAGLLLVLVGAYVTYYGWWEVQILAGRLTGEDSIVNSALGLQGKAADLVRSIAPGWWVAALIFLMTLAFALRGVRKRTAIR